MTRPIHEILKEVRSKAGIDLETVSKDTFIPIKFLREMENGQWQAFSSTAHRIGFLKKYLAYLKIPSDILLEYPEFYPVAESVENVKNEKPAESSLIWILIVSSVFLCLLLFLLLFNKDARLKENFVSVDSGYVLPDPVKENRDIKLKAIDDVWIRVAVDDKKIVEKILKAGESISISGNEIFIRIGNAGGLLIERNGETTGPFGKLGQVKELRINNTGKKR
ncbi:MAG: DUF4115 domain-containing protein [Candidatus Omnitrophica bacterium]|nr:DUF4115 domain-containing protein [Candidatus Omnitrophota bacterium]MCM8827768.1 DUF4115 domain-containing protein [Candidatus Omnitrophota bacterium]